MKTRPRVFGKSTTAGGRDPVIIALHGFLGLPADWDRFRELLGPRDQLQTRSLWKDLRLISARAQSQIGSDGGSPYSPQASLAFDLWAEQFVKEVEGRIATGESRPVLMGYSMGGRLALHAAIRRPDLFRACILISVNPGLSNPEEGGVSERELRLHADQHWAEQFLTEPWDEMMKAWSAQPVFNPPPGATEFFSVRRPVRRPLRREEDFDRLLLADALVLWSLARQKDLRKISSLPPTLLVTGEFDPKFTDLNAAWAASLAESTAAVAKPEASANPQISHQVIAGAGHRVPWDQPRAFIEAVREWLAREASRP